MGYSLRGCKESDTTEQLGRIIHALSHDSLFFCFYIFLVVAVLALVNSTTSHIPLSKDKHSLSATCPF